VADVCITEYTDPGCPWAYSAESFRGRLTWLYGDRVTSAEGDDVAAAVEEDKAKAREGLGRVASEQRVGFDGLWSLPQ
jgi:hypothetical protein